MVLPIRRGGALRRRGPMWGSWDPSSEFEDMWSQTGRLLERAAVPTAAPDSWTPTVEETEEVKRRKIEIGEHKQTTGEIA